MQINVSKLCISLAPEVLKYGHHLDVDGHIDFKDPTKVFDKFWVSDQNLILNVATERHL